MLSKIRTATEDRKASLVNGVKALGGQVDEAKAQITALGQRIQELRDNIHATNGAIAECDVTLAAIAMAEVEEASANAEAYELANDGLPTTMGRKPVAAGMA